MSKIRRELDILRDTYHQDLPNKLKEIQEKWFMAAATGDARIAQDFYRLAHGLAGSAGVFGLPEVAAVARELERHLESTYKNGALFEEGNALLCNSNLQRLFALLEENRNQVAPTVALDSVSHYTQERQKGAVILVVDDDHDTRVILSKTLSFMGHEVVEADSSATAIASFELRQPDIVFMDVVMPGMNGYELTKRLKDMAGNTFVPVIFLTSIADDQMLAKCVESGGDDFLTKPFNKVILAAKISALLRIKSLHRELERYKNDTEEEIAQAEHVFNAVVGRSNQDNERVHSWSLSATHFNGDAFLYRTSPTGILHVFLADFTGHGLAPAVGTVLAAEIFHDHTESGDSAEEILKHINNKFNKILPVGRFCAAAMIAVDFSLRRAFLWNCGLPSVLVVDHQCGVAHRFASTHLPLGVVQITGKIPVAEFSIVDAGAAVM
ncbi:MAG: response regulator, partial [Gammaproteobacteria bacterium]|nr:response regulator [Gammaproteobacteria bacterium]